VFTLGSPVTHADTLNQLLHVFEQQGIENRPIVVINPVDDSLPDLEKLLENYIENAMQGTLVKQRTTYMFQDASDEEIFNWAKNQYRSDAVQTVDSLIETGMAIRDQSRLKRDLDVANARRDELWKQHCLNPESDAGSAEYSDITYNVIPRIERAIKDVTKRMGSIPKDLKNGYIQEPISPIVENPVESVENHTELVQNNVENFVETVDNHLEMIGTGKPNIMLIRATNMIMPLSVAKQMVNNPQNSAYKKQQEMIVPGYTTVPLEYLLALGVQLYADGVPIVYTKTGGFRRVGDSEVSPVVHGYWYPTPRYK
jgi:hypothetical protein